MATFEIFAHLDAAGRQEFQGPDDARPLTKTGRRQAEKIADELLAEGLVDGVFASENTRCRQSLEPLAQRAGVQVGQVRSFQAPPVSEGGTRDPLTPAHQAGRILAELQDIQAAKPDGRFVICSNGGDLITSLMAFVAGSNGQPIPPKLEVSIGPAGSDLRRGNVYTIMLNGDKVTSKQREASAGFPQAVAAPV